MRRVNELVSSSLSNALININTWGGVMYNVLEYGIVGDGGTDNTEALQSLIATAISADRKVIFFPAGTYYVTVLTSDDEVLFLGDNATFVGGYNGYIQQLGEKDYKGIHRQAIMNGNFNIWQRGTPVVNPSTPQYTADRFFNSANADGGVLPTTITHSRLELTPGDISGSYYGYRINCSDAGSNFGVNASLGIFQRIEYGTRFLCGLGKKIHISFWAKSSITNKKIGLSVSQRYGSGGTPSGNELLGGTQFTLTSSWKRYTAVFETNTLFGKTFGTTTSDFLQIGLMIMWGATSATTFGLSGSEGFISSGNIDIAQLQVNSGSSDLPFFDISYAEELNRCQRYYERFDGSAGAGQRLYNNGSSAGNIGVNVMYRVQKMATPTVSLTYDINDGSSSTVNPGVITKDGFSHTVGSVPAGQFVDVQTWSASSEL
jgi:hypothetical protein